MAFETVTDLNSDKTISLGGFNKKTNKPNPTQVEGYFMGSREVSSPKSKTGKAMLFFFLTAEGPVGVWGKTDLERKMASVTLGVMTRASFVGMKQTKNGEMYTYKVEIDRDNTTNVSEASSVAEDYDDGEDETPLDEIPPPPHTASAPTASAAPNEERQARAQALTNARRSALNK